MLLLVTAAEMQYRLESEIRDRDLARIAMMRERQDAIAAEAAAVAAPVPRRSRAANRERSAWPRPIGMQASISCPCPVA
ncbi:hypothetical protein [Microbacterium invictum]|uniref:Uncharacterized protein n=1 Tax=Microbacterium invictum TaxID=515415 RepID=A0AA40SS70_9MICO|nr:MULTISPECIES: hypothetical protein [Microbacterium]MBB4141486.1 hypothetical protein [Microbacterium invictum]